MTEATISQIDGGRDYTVRQFTNGDVWKAGRIVAKVLANPNMSINAARIQSDSTTSGDEKNQSLLWLIVGAAMESAPDDIEAFLADMCSMKAEQFRKLDFNATPDILAELAGRDDFTAFLRSCMNVSSVAKAAFSKWQNQSRESTATSGTNSQS